MTKTLVTKAPAHVLRNRIAHRDGTLILTRTFEWDLEAGDRVYVLARGRENIGTATVLEVENGLSAGVLTLRFDR
jgi:hypothetical protein